MARYIVTFKCLIPSRVDTVIEADNVDELIRKIENKDIGEFHFKTVGDFTYIQDLMFEEVKD